MRQARDLLEILQEANQEVNPELYELAGLSKTLKTGRKSKLPFVVKVFNSCYKCILSSDGFVL